MKNISTVLMVLLSLVAAHAFALDTSESVKIQSFNCLRRSHGGGEIYQERE